MLLKLFPGHPTGLWLVDHTLRPEAGTADAVACMHGLRQKHHTAMKLFMQYLCCVLQLCAGRGTAGLYSEGTVGIHLSKLLRRWAGIRSNASP